MNKVGLDVVREKPAGFRALSVKQLETEGQNRRPRGEREL